MLEHGVSGMEPQKELGARAEPMTVFSRKQSFLVENIQKALIRVFSIEKQLGTGS